MDQLMLDYLSYLKHLRGLSPRSLQAYTLDLTRWQEFLDAEGLKVLEADNQTAGGFLLERRRGGLSPAGVNRQLGALRGFYRYLVRIGKLKINPFTGLRTLRNPRKLPRVLRPSELKALLGAVQGGFQGLRDRLVVELLYATGCRASELLGLRLSDAEKAADRLKVLGKGKKERVVFLTPGAKTALENYLRLRKDPSLFESMPTHGLLLVNRHGEPLTAAMLAHLLKKRLQEAGIFRRVTPHTFRHTFATDILEGGADIRQVQELLGHAHVATTQIYTHVGLERLRTVLKHAHPHGGNA